MAVMVFGASCTLGGGTSNPTADVSPVSSPSSTSSTPVTSSPPASSPSAAASPSASSLAVTSIPTHNGEVGVGYLAVTVQATGGTPPYTWSATGLPPGLALSPQGVISGNNTKAGNFGFTLTVTDSNSTTASAAAKMTVFPAFAVSSPCAKFCNVGVGCTVCGTFGAISGGAGPYTYKIVSGAPPPGMSWNGRLSLIGAFPAPPPPNLAQGPPPAPIPFTVSVTDDFGVTRTVTPNWSEFGAVNFVSNSGPPYAGCYQPGSGACTIAASGYSLTYTLGNPTDNIAVVVVRACYDNANGQIVCSDDPGAGPLADYIPPGWTATAKGGSVTVSVDCGNPDQCTAKTGGVQWAGDVYIVLVDKGACVAPANARSAMTADVNIDF